MANEPTDVSPAISADAAAVQRAEALLGTVLAGRYRIDGIIAMGGMGAVFRGEHVHMRKRVAVKVLHPGTQNLPELVTRFERESIVGAHATHANVTSATDFGRLEDGSYYLVLEYVDGITLHELMQRGPIPVARAVEIARQIALGLEAIHRLDIFHRDLKPRNVMIVEGTPDIVKILDFGFAKVPLERFSPSIAEAISVTSRGTVFGTVGYMAPETAYGMHAVTHKSDLYALGVLLYEMLTGLHPFDDTDSRALFQKHQMVRPPSFAARAPGRGVPRDVEAITMRLLEKAPRDRFENARDVIAALERSAQRIAANGALGADGHDAAQASDDEAGPGGRARASKRTSRGRDASERPDDSPPPSTAAATKPRRGSVLPWTITFALVAIAALVWRFPDWRERLQRLVGQAHPAPTSPGPATVAAQAPAASSAPASAQSAATASASATAASAAPSVTAVNGLDAAKWRGVLKEAATVQDATRGARALLALVELEPQAFREPDIVAAAAVAAVGIQNGDKTIADAVYGALGGERIGSGGPDVLFQMTRVFGGSRGAKRAAELLATPEVAQRRTAALRIAMALRDTPCKQRGTLFEQAATDGDERTATILSDMRSPSCTSSTGACCLPNNPALEATLAQLRLRLANAK